MRKTEKYVAITLFFSSFLELIQLVWVQKKC